MEGHTQGHLKRNKKDVLFRIPKTSYFRTRYREISMTVAHSSEINTKKPLKKKLFVILSIILTLAIIAVNMVVGLLRGFRKSLILLVQYIISFAVGIVVFFQAISITYSNQLGGILSSLGPEYAEANSITDVVHIFLGP